MAMMKKAAEKSSGYPEVPVADRRMIAVKYDLYPYVLVHRAHRLGDNSYRWVSSWESGHQNLGVFTPGSKNVVAVLSVEEGQKLGDELESLTNEHWEATVTLHEEFYTRRNALLSKYFVSRFLDD